MNTTVFTTFFAASLIVAGIAATACDGGAFGSSCDLDEMEVQVDPECDPDLEECEYQCVPDGEGDTFNPDNPGDDNETDPNDDTEAASWPLIVIENASNNLDGQDPGADIDAVELIKANGQRFTLREVVEFELHSEADNALSNVLGPPDATERCEVDRDQFAGLGEDGYFVASFGPGVMIEPGDVITVHEFGTQCGDDYFNDAWTLYVTGEDPSSEWVQMCYGTGLESCDIVDYE